MTTTTQDFGVATDLFIKCVRMQTEVLEQLMNYYKEQNINSNINTAILTAILTAMQKYVDTVQTMLLTMKATK